MATLLCGCAAFFFFASFPWVPLVLGLVALGLGVAARAHIAGPREGAMVCLGATLGIAAILLFWMTPGFHTIIWGS